MKSAHTLVQKNHLLPIKEEKKDDFELPLSRNFEEQIAALFHAVNFKETPVLFYESGWEKLFPEKDTVHQGLYINYLAQGIDVRPWALEAFLNQRISANKMISIFFEAATFVEFPYNPKQFDAIHKKGKLTKTGNMFYEYLTNTLPHPLWSIYGPERVEIESRIKKFLETLPEKENYLLHGSYDVNQAIHMAAQIVNRIIDRGLKSYITRGYLINYLSAIADELEFHGEFRENLAVFLSDMTKYVKDHPLEGTRLFVASVISVLGSQTLTPFYINGEYKFFIVRCELNDLWLTAITGQNPNRLVQRVPMFGDISAWISSMSEIGKRPMGLVYPGIPVKQQIHHFDINAYPLSYSYAHDERVHKDSIFFYRFYALELFKMHHFFAEKIREVTGRKVTHVSTRLSDMANNFFLAVYKKDNDTLSTLVGAFYYITYEFSLRETRSIPANREYALIGVIDLFKNLEEYLKLLRSFAKRHTPASDEDMIKAVIKSALYLEADSLLPELLWQQQEYLKKYSYSLGVFGSLLLLNAIEPEKVLELCEKLHELELKKECKFIWNPKGGIILKIDDHYFQFHGKDPFNDFRFRRVYPEGIIRHYSSDRAFVRDLDGMIELKQQPPYNANLNFN